MRLIKTENTPFVTTTTTSRRVNAALGMTCQTSSVSFCFANGVNSLEKTSAPVLLLIWNERYKIWVKTREGARAVP